MATQMMPERAALGMKKKYGVRTDSTRSRMHRVTNLDSGVLAPTV